LIYTIDANTDMLPVTWFTCIPRAGIRSWAKLSGSL